MTQENGHSLPVLCRVLSQNHTTHHENVPGRERRKRGKREMRGRETEKKGGEGAEGGERKKEKDKVREDIHMHVLHVYTNLINIFV